MPDIETVCIQCREIFLFTEKEQETFYQRNMTAPQRCPKCSSRKAAVAEHAPAKYEIVCDNCGKHDRVPFQPKIGRAVFCRECHEASRSRARFA